MNLGLNGKTALVLASTQGLGLACAAALLREGAVVAINGRSQDTGERAVAALPEKAAFLLADTTNPEQRVDLLERVRDHLGRIDILVLNGGGPSVGPFEDTSLDDWQEGFEQVVLPAVDLARQCVPEMREAGWGRIVSLSSISGKEISLSGARPNALRPALVGALGTLAREVAASGITVNSILSGPFDTPGLRSVVRQHSGRIDLSEEEAVEVYAQSGPMRRVGQLDEMGDLCAFLCSSRAAYITGQAIVLDGGRIPTLY